VNPYLFCSITSRLALNDQVSNTQCTKNITIFYIIQHNGKVCCVTQITFAKLTTVSPEETCTMQVDYVICNLYSFQRLEKYGELCSRTHKQFTQSLSGAFEVDEFFFRKGGRVSNMQLGESYCATEQLSYSVYLMTCCIEQ